MEFEQPEILLRIQIPEEYIINAIQVKINHLQSHLEQRPAVIFNFYAQKYGVEIKEYKYSPSAGYFVDIDKRIATHRFECKGVERRDKTFDMKYLQPLVPYLYRNTYFDQKDAKRSYIIPITNIVEINPISIENFKLWEGAGKITTRDLLHHPRPIEPYNSN
jgi:hypothetical protein